MEEVTMENNENAESTTEAVTEPTTQAPETTEATEESAVEIKDPAGLLKAYEQAKQDLVALRNEHKELKSQYESASSNDEWKTKAINAEIRLALNSQGIKDTARLMKYMNTEGIDFDEHGNLSGLTERLNALKADLPELFDVKRQVGGRADIFADNSTEVKPDPFRAQIRQALSH